MGVLGGTEAEPHASRLCATGALPSRPTVSAAFFIPLVSMKAHVHVGRLAPLPASRARPLQLAAYSPAAAQLLPAALQACTSALQPVARMLADQAGLLCVTEARTGCGYGPRLRTTRRTAAAMCTAAILSFRHSPCPLDTPKYCPFIPQSLLAAPSSWPSRPRQRTLTRLVGASPTAQSPPASPPGLATQTPSAWPAADT
jgi:hypothetical protein